jgi:hypothetical protein
MTIDKIFLLTLWAGGIAVYAALTLVRGFSTRVSPLWNERLKWIAPIVVIAQMILCLFLFWVF